MKPNKYASPYGRPPVQQVTKKQRKVEERKNHAEMVDAAFLAIIEKAARRSRIGMESLWRRMARDREPSIAEGIKARWDARKEARILRATTQAPNTSSTSRPTRL